MRPFDGNSPLVHYVVELSENSKTHADTLTNNGLPPPSLYLVWVKYIFIIFILYIKPIAIYCKERYDFFGGGFNFFLYILDILALIFLSYKL